MQIQSLGHAGLRVDAADLSIMMDPWFSEMGAFQSSWFQFPRNDHLDVAAISDCDWVTVSHEHLDHADLSVLTRLPERTRVLIPKYQSPNHRDRLARGGVRNVIEVAAWERFPLNTNGDWLTFIPEISPMCQDAAVLISAGGRSLLHVNDARLTAAQVRRASHEVGGRLDVMAIQMACATWHPIAYEYPPEAIEQISEEKRIGKFKAVARLVRATRPELVVPFAGPMCFLDPELRKHNRWIQPPGIFPHTQAAAAWLSERVKDQSVMHWMPGDRFDVLSGALESDPIWEGFSFDDLDDYFEEYAADRAPQIRATHEAYPEADDGLAAGFAEHFSMLGGLNSYFLRRIGMTIRFEVEGGGGGTWDVRLGPEDTDVDLTGGASDVQYRFRVDSRWLEPVISGELGWEDLFLSLRFSAWREPDVYNDYLIGLLKHAEPVVLAAVEDHETNRASDERFVVASDGGNFEVGRYCPHAGEDLSIGGLILGGDRLRCLGHNFEFDLRTGECVNARCDPLASRPVQTEASPVPESA
ncbi:MAG: MBL fold metallo-hydrolase [Actinomycetota bacterium]